MNAEHVLQAAGLVLACGIVVSGLVAYTRHRRPFVITCPAGTQRAAIQVDARYAAWTAVPRPQLRVTGCTRWPERRNCDQRCIEDIDPVVPVATVQPFESWYAGRRCARCAVTFMDLRWIDRPPAVLETGGRLLAWYEVPAERLRSPEVLPICWGCHALATMRLEDESEAAPPSAVESKSAVY